MVRRAIPPTRHGSRTARSSIVLHLLLLALVATGAFAGTPLETDDARNVPLGTEPIGVRFGDCPPDAVCDASPSGTPFPPSLVTGHSIYAAWTVTDDDSGPAAPPTLPAQPDDATQDPGPDGPKNVQRECMVWFDGRNLDQRPGQGDNEAGLVNHPSDGALPGGFGARQDYSFDRDAPDCTPHSVPATLSQGTLGLPTDFAAVGGHFQYDGFEAAFIVAVESGDCDPVNEGTGHRFRGHLDFVDPNGIYHEVQEYDYHCPTGGTRNLVPGTGVLAPAVHALFPLDGEDAHNADGCTPGSGHKCNGTVQDLLSQRLWITRVHDPVFDRTIERPYNFALQVDTCAGVNIYEADGKTAMGATNDHQDAHRLPDGDATSLLLDYHDIAYHLYYLLGADALLGGWPLPDVCTDGSSFSFTTDGRARLVHAGPPAGRGDEEIMRGNSFDFDADSATWAKHRTNCRSQILDWPMNTYPPGPPPTTEDCHPEDHKTAHLDLYAYPKADHPLFALFAEWTNDRTGPDTWHPSGAPTGPA